MTGSLSIRRLPWNVFAAVAFLLSPLPCSSWAQEQAAEDTTPATASAEEAASAQNSDAEAAAKSAEEAASETPPLPPVEPDEGEAAEDEQADGEESRTLRFTFRFQKWEDVLDWFAQQAGLSLVMDRPPPGTFNYTDDKEYSVSEALDVLNSVLLTKGYTLVRRGNMLLVLDAQEEIPHDVIPRVTLEELEDRGQFELVSVMFPLDGRPPEAAEKEIQPLLSSLGSVAALPETGQMLVTERAGVMRAIATVIESIPKPKKREKPAPEPDPELTVYPLENADPARVTEVLKQLVSGATFVADEEARQINAYATPNQHRAIEKLLDEMDANVPADEAPRLEVYPVNLDESSRRGRTRSQLVPGLQLLVPEMRLMLDEDRERLIAWGTPQEHETLGEALSKLEAGTLGDGPRQVELYSLTRVAPDKIESLVSSLFPGVDLFVDTENRRLVVVAPAQEQQAIGNLMDQLQPAEPGPDSPELRVYGVSESAPETLTTTLQSLAPAAQITLAPDGGQLYVVASAESHQTIEQALQQWQDSAQPQVRNKLKFYSVTPAQRTRFEAILSDLTDELPGIRLVQDAEPGELAVWAKPDQHEVLDQVLEGLNREVPEEERHQLFSYPLEKQTFDTVASVIEEIYPELKLIEDPADKRLLVWTDAARFEQLRETLEELEPQSSSDQEPRYEVYTIRGIDPAAASTQLESVVPEAKLSVDAASGKLIAWAAPEDHEVLKRAIDQLGTASAGADKRQVEVLPMKGLSETPTLSLMESLFPAADITVDSDRNRLVVTGVPEDLEAVRSLLEQLQVDRTGERRLSAYPLEVIEAENAVQLLSDLYPDAKIVTDEGSNRLLIWAEQEQHEAIRSSIGELDTGTPADRQERLVVYPLDDVDGSMIVEFLQDLVPDANIKEDTQANTITAYAKPAEHERIAEIMEQAHAGGAPSARPVVRVYPGPLESANDTISLLKTLEPDAQIIPNAASGGLAIFATPEQHETLSATLMQLKTQVGEQQSLKSYTLNGMTAQEILPLLSSAVPDVTLTPSRDPQKLLALARPEQHEKIAAMVETAQAEGAYDDLELQLYSVDSAQASVASQVVTNVAPSANVSEGARSGQLIVWATAKEHEAITGVLQQLEQAAPRGELKAHKLDENVDGFSAYRMLSAALPEVTFVRANVPGRLLAWASPEDHQTIEQLLQQVAQEGGQDERIMAVYPLKDKEGGQSLQDALQPVLGDDVELVRDEARNSFIVWATPAEHEEIKETIEELLETLPEPDKATTKVYRLENGSASAAYYALRRFLSDADIGLDSSGNSLVVTASDEDHEVVQATVEQLEQSGQDDRGAVQVYRVDEADPASVNTALQSLYRGERDVRISVDSSNRAIIAVALPEEQAFIEQVIEQIDTAAGQGDSVTTAVYRFKTADPRAAYRALGSSVPDAEMGFDTDARTLIVTASEGDHEIVKTVVEEMEKAGLEQQAEVQVYLLQSSDPDSVSNSLNTLYRRDREVRFTVDSQNGAVVAVAPPETQQAIADIIQQMEDQGTQDDRELAAYPIDDADAESFTQILEPLMPQGVSYVHDERRDSLVVWATAEQHEKISKSFEELIAALPEADEPATVVYHLDNASASAAYNALSRSMPNAVFGLDTVGNSLIVTADPREHEVVKTAVEQLDEAGLGDDKTVQVYKLVSVDPSAVTATLSDLYRSQRDVNISANGQNRSIVAVAPAEEQQFIEQVIEQMEADVTEKKGWMTKVYHFEASDPQAAQEALRELIPTARIVADRRGGNLVITASQEDHGVVETTVEEMNQASSENDAKLQVYPLDSADPSAVYEALEELYRRDRNVRISVDRRSRNLLAVAAPDEHESIKQLIEQLEAQGANASGHSTRVYHFQVADPGAAQQALSDLLPDAQLASDSRAMNLIATARSEDHEIIKSTVEEMDQLGLEDESAPRVYRLESLDPADVYEVLQDLYRRSRGTSISVDRDQEAIVAVATPKEHEAIGQLIDDLEQGANLSQGADPVAYDLGEADGEDVREMLSTLFPDEDSVQLSVLPQSNKLVAIARPKDQERIKKTLEEMKVEDHQLEVFRLRTIDPFSARLAIESLYGSSFLDGSNAPRIETDPGTQQLFVRATPEQLEKVRDLLVKMGEPQLDRQRRPSTGTVRSVPFSGDVKSAIGEIERLWPQMRKNKIRVVTPSEQAPPLRSASPPAQSKDKDKDKDSAEQPPDGSAEPQPASEQGASMAPRRPAPATAQLVAYRQEADSEAERTEQESAGAEEESAPPTPRKPAPDQEPSDSEQSPEVVIIPGTDSITVASQDQEALDQIESLLEAMNREETGRSRNFVVFSLRNAAATAVAETLEQLFEGIGADLRGGVGQVVAIPDERLNSLVVYANPSDQEIVEDLIEVLDTSEIPESVALVRPTLIPIKNTHVSEIEEVLRDLYETQLRTGGGRRQIDVPPGAPPAVANMLRQVSAATSAPLLTISSDEMTNTLILMGPVDLVDEISQVVEDLDQGALNDNPTRRLRILSLEKMNTERLDEALDVLLRSRSRSRRRR